MKKVFFHPEHTNNESENFEYYLTNCDRVNSTASDPSHCILLIGGGEDDTPGEDAATQWFLDNADREYWFTTGGISGFTRQPICS